MIPYGHVMPSLDTGYNFEQSLRLNDDDSAYLNRTPSVAGNRKTWTFRTILKRGELSSLQWIFGRITGAGDTMITFDSNDRLYLDNMGTLRTSMLFRDPSAWYDIQIAVDTTQATASNRVKIYVNGTQVTDFDTETYPSQNADLAINDANNHGLGARPSIGQYFDGYFAETYFINGQQVAPTEFGEFDATYGHWKPKEYEGTYGTNGFYLDFADGANIGNDVSGNNNDFTATNLSDTDIVLDSPTNNFAVLNPLATNLNITLSEGGLRASTTSNGTSSFSSFAMSSGKWYVEVISSATTASLIGIVESTANFNADYMNQSLDAYSYYFNGVIYSTGYATADTGASHTSTDIVSMAIDMDSATKTVKFYKNNVLQTTQTLTGSEYVIAIGDDASGSDAIYNLNFGQDSSFAGNKTAQGNTDSNGIGDFYYAPPSGYLALCTANLPEPTVVPSEHFNVVTYTGNVTARSIVSGVNTDFVWGKARSIAYSHCLFDVVRGTEKRLLSQLTNAEDNLVGSVTSFNSDGFDLGTETNLNANGQSYVAWNWKAGGVPVTNNAGTITSQVSANVDAGFSIVGYISNGSAHTVGHGLNKTPEAIILKDRDGVASWHCDILGYELRLNTTSGDYNADTWWGTHTSSVVSVGHPIAPVNTHKAIMYCFHSVEGYSKIGSYTGNGNPDGTFVYLGFSAKWIMIKESSASGDAWYIVDTERDTINPMSNYLTANNSNVENTSYNWLDINANGFKMRDTTQSWNEDGQTYMFYAVAENPFKYTNAR